ncbi:MAG: hypothetical protein IJI35_04410 [Kiritimatiellae bacterium]|nr:hypothetical protein [Atopobiaceae bacterium]MBQ6328237.1 hypothetical protein [Kiritimatiellia bacterium]
MEAFASTSQYRAKYATEMADEALAEWLADATDVMRGELDASGIDYSEPSEGFEETLMRICRDVAHRAIGEDDDVDFAIPYGATQVNMTGGSYSRGFSFGNPYDDLFLTATEKRRLGIGAERACVLSPYGGE